MERRIVSMSQATTGLINIILSCEKRKRHTCRTVKTATKNNKLARNLFFIANVRVNLSKERSVFIKMFIKMFISKEYVEKYGKNNKKINLSINSCQFIAVVLIAAKFRLKENLHLNIFLPEKNHTGRSN